MATRIPAGGWQLEENSAEAYERYLVPSFTPWASDLVALANVQTGERVLDVACGTGVVARHAAAKTGAAGRVVGIDVNEEMLKVAGAATAGISPPIEWRQGNAAALPFPDAAFDVVFCEQAMQFFSEPVPALREMRRVMTSGGRAAVSVCRPIVFSPAYASMASALERFVGPEAGAVMRSPFPTWNVGQFRSLFSTAGFRHVHVRIVASSIRYPSCEQFLLREAASSPLAALVTPLGPEIRGELVATLERALADHRDDDGVLCPIEIQIALARP